MQTPDVEEARERSFLVDAVGEAVLTCWTLNLQRENRDRDLPMLVMFVVPEHLEMYGLLLSSS